MRVWFVAFVMLACGVCRAEDAAPAPAAQPASDQSGISVNFDALPVDLAKVKPKAAPVRPLALARPRPKPEPAAVETKAPASADAQGAPAAAVAALTTQAAPAAVEKPKKPSHAPPPLIGTAPAQAEAPVTIVSSSAKALPVEISGVAQNPFAGSKNVNPLDGFAILSRVRFRNGKSDILPEELTALDALAQRLQGSEQRVRLAAFSGKAGDLSSEARRLSLARALAVRHYLAMKGVPMARVDVQAFGGATDGIPDRVDVLARGT